MKLSSFATALFRLVDHHGRLVHQPDFAGLAAVFSRRREQWRHRRRLLLAEVEDVAVGLGVVEHAVGAGEGLNQAVVLQVLVHVERVQVLGIEAGEQHVHHDGDVDLLGVRMVGIGELLVLDALLHVLVVEIEFADAVIGAEAGVVVGDDGLERRFLFFRRLPRCPPFPAAGLPESAARPCCLRRAVRRRRRCSAAGKSHRSAFSLPALSLNSS